MAVRTLQELLKHELDEQGETRGDLYSIVVSEGVAYRPTGALEVTYEDLAEYEGDIGYGGQSLPRLHAWTEDRVYFKVVYDGSERVSSVPRNPDTDETPGYYGGG